MGRSARSSYLDSALDELLHNWKIWARLTVRIDKSPGQGPHGDCWEWLAACNPDGYGVTAIALGAFKIVSFRVTQVVWMYVNKQLTPRDLEISHTCHNRKCCRYTHFVLESHKKNMHRSTKAGRMASGNRHGTHTKPQAFSNPVKGEDHYSSKLTEDDVRHIRKVYTKGKIGVHRLARRYGISKKSMYKAIHRVTWKHVV